MTIEDADGVNNALRELTDQLLRDMCIIERRTPEREAALSAVATFGMFIHRLAELEQRRGRFTNEIPETVLFRLGHALAGLDEGTVDPILKPAIERRSRVVDAREDKRQGIGAGPTVNILVARATAAAAMDLLMFAGRTRKDAACEVADILKDDPVLANSRGEPWRTVARWREEIMAQVEKRELPDIDQAEDYAVKAAGQFNFLVNEAKRLVDAGKATPADLGRIAHYQLNRSIGMSGPRNSGKAGGFRNTPRSNEGA